MQVKVTNTVSHKTSQGDVLVTKGKLVLIHVKPGEDGFFMKNGVFKPIIISETEKIEGGDWYYANKTLFKADEKLYEGNDPNTVKNQFKILALPEHFSPKQLQAIVDGKLKDGDEVYVECIKQWIGSTTHYGYKIDFNSDNHITLHKEVA